MTLDCSQHPLSPPKVVARATDPTITQVTSFPDTTNLPLEPPLIYGQDLTYGYGRHPPGKQGVGDTPAILKPKMRKLLSIFASGDNTGMATRLFDAFLADTCRLVTYFDDAALNAAAAKHENIIFFCDAALSAPNLKHRSDGHTRIHQALKAAGWDITKITVPSDLGVPAFNQGSGLCGGKCAKAFSVGDFNNGLGLMINGVQHAYAVATHYLYDKATNQYAITLKYFFYDVFGLDDIDLRDFGTDTDDSWFFASKTGITAWWQLQHQHGCAPLITRAMVEKTYVAPAT